MSVKALTWVWAHGPKEQSALLVMLALADFCNDEGECWPSMASIAAKARLTERGAQKVIRRMEAQGHLSVDVGGGRKRCNVYRIAMRNPEHETPNHVHPEPRSPRTAEHKPRTEVQETPNTGSPEPSRNHQGTVKVSRIASETFEDFWRVYPRKTDKGKARQAYVKALTKTDPETLKAAAQRFKDLPGREAKFTPHPTTWLNGERWDDELDAPAQHTPPSQSDTFLRRIAGGRP